MYTIHNDRDSTLLRNSLAVGITSLFLLISGLIFGQQDHPEGHLTKDAESANIIHGLPPDMIQPALIAY